MAKHEDDGYLASSSSNNELSVNGGDSLRPSAISFQVPATIPRPSVISIASTRHTGSFSSVFTSASIAPPIITIPDVPQPTLTTRRADIGRLRGLPPTWGASPRAAAPSAFLNLPSSPIRKSSVTFADERRPSLPISIPASSVGGYSRRGSGMDSNFVDLSKSEPGPSRIEHPWELNMEDIFSSGGFILGGYSAPAGVMSEQVKSSRQDDHPHGRDPFLSMVETDDPEYAATKVAWSIRLKATVETELSFGRSAAIWTCPLLGSFRVSQVCKEGQGGPSIYVTTLGLSSSDPDPAFPTVRVTMKVGKDTSIQLQPSVSEFETTGKSMDVLEKRIILATRILHEEAYIRQQREERSRRATAAIGELSAVLSSEDTITRRRLAKRSSSISRFAQTLAGRLPSQSRSQQPNVMEFMKRAFGFKRPLRGDHRGSLSPPALSPGLSRPSVSTIADMKQIDDIPSFTAFEDVNADDIYMVLSLPRRKVDNREQVESAQGPAESAPRLMPHQSQLVSASQLLICYIPWSIVSSVPMSPAQELRHQSFNEDLAALYAKFRSYRILARPMEEGELSRNGQPPGQARSSGPPLQLIGFCEGPLQGVEFIPETLRAVGICEMKGKQGVWHPSTDEWMDMVVTPGGHEVMHLIWAGCVALSGLGRI
ncbi:hypothetical protein CALCODRAFT_303710 [Calocera cornea HHB12733]|uniref:Uncharacterized protein n=1 Tax=Calocera cornea HHB12733 TaxID=1353952 RepID=A0A165JK68_9BASI|nr:hypothetical protein CALCODRAFT_303710 [Calocera cornea HHB12733]